MNKEEENNRTVYLSIQIDSFIVQKLKESILGVTMIEIYRYYGYRIQPGFSNNIIYQEVWNDKRVNLMDSKYFENQNVLDIGCNAGYVDIIIGERYHPQYILGVDLDAKLIARARTLLAQKVLYQSNSSSDTSVPSSCFSLHTNTYLPYTGKLFQYPYNIFFKVENFITEPHYGRNYHTILCLSTIKWIHLNYGDTGLLQFFQKVYTLLTNNGIFILEPQPWSSYKKKRTLNEHIYNTYHSIQIRPESFPKILEEMGMKCIQILEQEKNPHDGFSKRPIYIFKKIK